MKTAPFYSSEKKTSAYEHKETCYHDNDSCSKGMKIRDHHLEVGTGSRPLCKECAQLRSAVPFRPTK
jgi:hypothetical protein